MRNVAAGSIVRQTTLEEGTKLGTPLVEFYLKDDENEPIENADEMFRRGAAAVADVIPGMISNDTECSTSGSISSRSLAKIVGSPPFKRTTV